MCWLLLACLAVLMTMQPSRGSDLDASLTDWSSARRPLHVAAAASSEQAPNAKASRREAFREARDRLRRDRDQPAQSLSERFSRQRQLVAAMLALARDYPDLPSERHDVLVAAVMESSTLAQMSRFSLGDPATAAALYEQALSVELPPGTVSLLQTIPRIGYADLARFDLHDPKRAARLLREARDRLSSLPDLNDPMSLLAHPIRRWIDAEIAFLETKRRASVPTAADCAPIELVYQFGPDLLIVGNEPLRRVVLNGKLYPRLSRTEIAAALTDLPPSAINLLGASDAIATLGSSDRILAFARKHDPAGYTTACVFWRLRRIALIPDKARREAAFEHYRWTLEDGRLLVAAANRVLGPVTHN